MPSKQEISELIVGLKDVALDVKSILKDGKVDMADLAVLPVLVAQQKELIAAVEGLGGIDLKSLQISDYVALVEELVAAAKAVSEA